MSAASGSPAAVALQSAPDWEAPPVCEEVLTASELRRRAEAGGVALLSPQEALQLVFVRLGPRRAAELAARLLARFGSLPEVLGAPLAELRQVAPASVAVEIKLLHELQLRVLREPFARRPVIASWSVVRDYLRAVMAALPREQFRVLFLDRRNRLIADEVLGWGSLDHAPVYPREVVRRALELNAAALILAHNHPAGDPTPSASDVDMTRQVVEAARALRIAVHDHLVIAGGGEASLKALGLM